MKGICKKSVQILFIVLLSNLALSFSLFNVVIQDENTISILDTSNNFSPKFVMNYSLKFSINSAIVYGRVIYLAGGNRVAILTVDNNGRVSDVNNYTLSFNIWSFDVLKGIIAVSSKSSVYIYDAYMNPKGSISLKYNILKIRFLDESHIIAILENGNIALINLSNPENPTLSWRLEAKGSRVQDLVYVRNYLFTVGKDGLFFVVDLSTFSKPKVVYYKDLMIAPSKIFSNKDRIYIVTKSSEFISVDVTDPFEPKMVYRQNLGDFYDINIVGDALYLGKGSGMLIYKIKKDSLEFVDIVPSLSLKKFAEVKGIITITQKVGTVIWTYNSGSEIRSTPAYYNGKVFFASINGTVYSVDKDGNFLWSYKTRFLINSPVVIDADGNVVVGSWDNHVYVISSSGDLVSRIKVSSDITKPVGIFNENFFVSSEDGKIHLVKKGKIVWSKEIDGWVTTNILVDEEGRVFFGTSTGKVYSLSYTGNFLWVYEASTWITTQISPDDENNLYFGTADGRLYKINLDGKLIWKYSVGSDITSGVVVDSFGRIIFGTKEGVLYALDKKGNTIWKYEVNSPIRSIPSVSKEGYVYFGADDGFFYSLNLVGSLRYRLRLDSKIMTSPLILRNQIIIAASNGKVYAIYDATKGLNDGPWPTCCGNNMRNKIMEY